MQMLKAYLRPHAGRWAEQFIQSDSVPQFPPSLSEADSHPTACSWFLFPRVGPLACGCIKNPLWPCDSGRSGALTYPLVTLLLCVLWCPLPAPLLDILASLLLLPPFLFLTWSWSAAPLSTKPLLLPFFSNLCWCYLSSYPCTAEAPTQHLVLALPYQCI